MNKVDRIKCEEMNQLWRNFSKLKKWFNQKNLFKESRRVWKRSAYFYEENEKKSKKL